MYTYDVSIGRNIGTEPMSDVEWDVFVLAVRCALKNVDETGTVDTWIGFTEWEGVTEESAHFQLRVDTLPLEYRTDILKADLRSLAEAYKQEAIALAVGRSELIV